MRQSAITLAIILALAAMLRFVGIGSGIPFNIGVDEPEIMERAVAMMRTGDFNPHFFDYPGLYFYVQLAVACARFLAGATAGYWTVARSGQHRRLLPVGPRRHRALRHADGPAHLLHRHALGHALRGARRRADGGDAAARARVALRADRRAGDVLRHADAAADAARRTSASARRTSPGPARPPGSPPARNIPARWCSCCRSSRCG